VLPDGETPATASTTAAAAPAVTEAATEGSA